MTTEEPIKFNGKRFKSTNSEGKKTIVEISKSTNTGESFYKIEVRKVVCKEDMEYLENFTIIRKFGDYYFIENTMLFTEKSFATIIEIAFNHLMDE